jgi:Histidine kinase-, DNA gyrase B-, and HSP90-like ATPase
MAMYTNSKIWRTTLGEQGDQFDGHRERLRQAYTTFRDRVGQLIQTIPGDTLGLTVHDLTHLDALWEMVDILTAGDYPLNPAEAFVLGGAILLHDSAMTVCAYRGGLAEIRMTPEFEDALAYFRSRTPTQSSGASELSPSLEQLALAETLRIRHASKAEELASQRWRSPLDDSDVFLIDDSELRDHYACSIGRIAHSHHWDITEVPRKLGTVLGAFTAFPAEWTIDQVKIALLLRCVDAMQIDDRRAPRFLASIRAIGSQSMEHWRFQNKLSQPHLEDEKLVYTSKSPFHIEEALAWNLCFDTIKMIDRELRDTNDVHLQKGLPEFSARGVAGAGSANTFARYVEVDGWKPIPLDLIVSDVPKLARTLGGKELYSNPLTPLRELIQNSADAIEARSLVEKEFSTSDGLISVRLLENEAECIIEIEDNGIGMSERVLTSALLDFGFSFWRSSEARAEFPGLQAEVGRFRGRYGIGFFSVFIWTGEVTVCSRRFNEAVDDARVLEFRHGIESRPILRGAKIGEKSSKWTTRIRLKLQSDFLETVIPRPDENVPYRYPDEIAPFFGKTWVSRMKLLCGTLPWIVSLETAVSTEQVSLPSWRDCSTKQFMDFFGDIAFKRSDTSERFIGTLTKLSDEPPLGGRCFISPYVSDGARVAVYEKGIFINYRHTPNIQGVVEASATNVERSRHSKISIFEDKNWINEVRSKAFALCRHLGEKIAIQQTLVQFGETDPNQPLFLRNREFISLSELKRQIVSDGAFYIRLEEIIGERDAFAWAPAEKLSTFIGLTVEERLVYPLVEFKGSIQSSSYISDLVEVSADPLVRLLKEIRDLFSEPVEISSDHHQAGRYGKDYIDIVIRPKVIS